MEGDVSSSHPGRGYFRRNTDAKAKVKSIMNESLGGQPHLGMSHGAAVGKVEWRQAASRPSGPGTEMRADKFILVNQRCQDYRLVTLLPHTVRVRVSTSETGTAAALEG